MLFVQKPVNLVNELQLVSDFLFLVPRKSFIRFGKNFLKQEFSG